MEKFHCEIWGQKINEAQCYFKREPSEYYKNPCCLECPKHRDHILQKLTGGPLSIEEPREKEVKVNTPKREKSKKKPTKIFRDEGLKKRWESLKADKNGLKRVRTQEGQEFLLDAFFKGGRIAYLEQLVEKIPYILNLHPSFWGNLKFFQWQLIRLNKTFQKDVDDFWRDYWPWQNSSGGSEDQESFKKNILVYYLDFVPRIGESVNEWKRRSRLKKLTNSFLERVLDTESNLKFQLGVINRYLFKYEDIFPVPWFTHFPLPAFLYEFFVPNDCVPASRRGRPQDWPKNFLIYELSKAGMKSWEIAYLLFGKEKIKYPDKDPFSVRINVIKKELDKFISSIYPPTYRIKMAELKSYFLDHPPNEEKLRGRFHPSPLFTRYDQRVKKRGLTEIVEA